MRGSKRVIEDADTAPPRPRFRAAALGVGLVGAGVLAMVLWSAAGSARSASMRW